MYRVLPGCLVFQLSEMLDGRITSANEMYDAISADGDGLWFIFCSQYSIGQRA